MKFTSRLGLKKPEIGDKALPEDFAENFDKIDAQAAGALLVTSTSRPSAPYVGQKIWETDTKQARIWNGTAWIWDGGVRPYGRMQKTGGLQALTSATPAVQALVADVNVGGVTYVGGGSPNQTNPGYLVVSESGLYRVKCVTYVSANSVANIRSSVVINNGTLGAAGDIATYDLAYASNTMESIHSGEAVLPLVAGQRVRMTAASNATSNTYGSTDSTLKYFNTSISVEYVSP